MTHALLSLLKKCTQTLKNVNLEYPCFNIFQFQASIRIFRLSKFPKYPLFFLRKKKLLGFRCW
jgi:hypothetical protein